MFITDTHETWARVCEADRGGDLMSYQSLYHGGDLSVQRDGRAGSIVRALSTRLPRGAATAYLFCGSRGTGRPARHGSWPWPSTASRGWKPLLKCALPVHRRKRRWTCLRWCLQQQPDKESGDAFEDRLSAQFARYKVYIIDEVHMLSTPRSMPC